MHDHVHPMAVAVPVAQLDIYVDEGCIGCTRALELAAWVKERFPTVTVRILELREDRSDQARLVNATPTYFLNGAQFSLGNPSPDELEVALLPLVARDTMPQ